MLRSRLLAVCALLLPASLLLSTTPAGAQSGEPEADTLRPPALIVRPEPGARETPLGLARVIVHVDVVGSLATTTLDLTFSNPNDRVLEGKLVLPLARGAAPSRFAMEVGDILREGVVVERERARVIFEEIVRGQVDPGLLEWAAGSAFRARVYPIPAGGTKRLVIAYEQDLETDARGARTYTLPLAYGAVAGELKLTVRAYGAGAEVLASPVGALERAEQGDAVVLRGAVTNATLDGALRLRFTSPASGEDNDGLRPRALVERGRDGHYLMLDVATGAAPRPRPAPDRVALLWDASGSRAPAERRRELGVVAEWLRGIGDVVVQLTVFSDAVWFTEELAVAGGDVSALLARLEGLQPDGGTDLSCLDLPALTSGAGVAVLVSDGMDTLAGGRPAPGACPLYAVTAAATADHAQLAAIARTGGLIDLATTSTDGALAQLRTEGVELLRVEAVGAPGAVVDVEPAPPVRVDAHMQLTARLRAQEPVTVRCVFGRGGEIVGTIDVPVDPNALGSTGRVERIWARARVARLMADKDAHRDEIADLGRRFGLVTPFTSMLVLETLDDYVRYEVTPPAELLEGYAEAMENKRKVEAEGRAARLEALRAKWRERVAWYETEFTYPPDLRVHPEADKARAEGAPGMEPATTPEASEGAGGADGTDSGELAPQAQGIEVEEQALRRLDEESAAAEAAASGAMRVAQEEAGAASGAAGRRVMRGGRSASYGGMAADAADDEAEGEANTGVGSAAGGAAPGGYKGVKLAAWTPGSPYLEGLEEAGEQAYRAYLAVRDEHAGSPAFFLDCADFFLGQEGGRRIALRVLSNVCELEVGSARLLRVVAHRYRQIGELERAAALFREVLHLRPEDPQSHRDLALALAALERWKEAIGHLEAVVLGSWDTRFPDIEVLVLGELNRVIARCERAAGERHHTLPDDLVRNLDTDLRVELTWDADNCDMDLWVIEPSGEKAYYGHTRTQIGGRFGRDFTQGYGPEEYLVRKVMPGTYKIMVHYYGDRQQSIAGATTVQVAIIKNHGRADEERTEVTRRLRGVNETLEIGEVTLP
jgi:tetratricopeptide (TPR) repeat protein